MALDTAPLPTRKKNLAFKLETTTGTPIALTGTEGVTNVFNAKIDFDTDLVERDGQGNLSSPIQGLGARKANVEFESELVGATPYWANLFLGCGMQVSTGTYTPLTSPTQTMTIGLYQAGRFKQAAGCMGSWTLNAKRGEKGRMKWKFLGVQCPPSSVSIITPTYDTTIAPRVGATTFTIGGTTYRIPEVEIDFENTVVLREDITALDSNSEATGYRAAYITNRKVTVKVSPEAMPLSTQDWYAIHRAGTTSALSLVIGATAGNIWTFSAPKMQLTRAPQDGDREGMLVDQLEFTCIRNAALGDDELSATLS
jgi:hypothetical protein